jgi:hypothetical protein
VRLAVVLLASTLALGTLSGCSSGHKASVPPTSTSSSAPGSGSSTIPTSTTAAPGSTTGPTTTRAATTTTSVAPTAFKDFTISPASPVSCSAPTMIELKWTGVGVSSVVLSIDGKPFATYGGGAQDHLEYFACDGKPHTYAISAKTGTTTATASAVVRSVPS